MRIDQKFKNDTLENKIISVFEPVTSESYAALRSFDDNKFVDQVFGGILWTYVNSSLKKYIAQEAFLKSYDSIFSNINCTYENIITLCKNIWGSDTSVQFDFATAVPGEVKVVIQITSQDLYIWVDNVYDTIVDESGEELQFIETGQYIYLSNLISLIRKLVPQGYVVNATLQVN